jgi:bifunctional non-homologous end joining protein LigD
MSEKSVFLYCTEGGSNKEYHVHLRARDGGWAVDFANGPRGKALRTGTKTNEPVALARAQDIFSRLVAEKKKGGYTDNESGTPYTTAEFAGRASGHRQQLPTAIGEIECAALIDDDRWVLQEKKDGERRTMLVKDSVVTGANKLGLLVSLPTSWLARFAALGNAEIDGEQIGSTLHAFDLLALDGQDLRARPFERRYEMLVDLLARFAEDLPDVELVRAHFGSKVKRAALERIEGDRREGAVFKNLDAPYDAGRSKAAYKFKLVEDSTCIVIAANQKRSVQIGLLDDHGNLVPVGNVTIPPSHAIPAVEAMIDVQYLYYNPGGALEQPVFKALRADVTRPEATLTQVTRIRPAAESCDETDAPRRYYEREGA